MSAPDGELKELYKVIFVQLMHVSQLLYGDYENFSFFYIWKSAVYSLCSENWLLEVEVFH